MKSKSKQREHDFSSIVENSTDIIARFDTDLRYIYCNKAVENQLGISIEALVGKTPVELTGQSAESKFIENSLRIALSTGEVHEVEQNYLSPSGMKYFNTRIIPERDKDGKINSLLAISRDLTERRLMEQTLREREEIFRAMFENNKAVKLLMDPENGAIIDANQAACEFYGYPRERLLKIRITDINTLSPEEEKAEMALAKVESRSYLVFKHRLANGEIRDVEIYSSPLNIQGRTLLFSIINDISKRKNAERALKESEARFETIFENSPSSIWEEDFSELKNHIDNLKSTGIKNWREYFDFHSDRIVQCTGMIKVVAINQTSVRFFGVHRKEEIPANLMTFFSTDSLAVFKEELIALAEGNTHFECEIPIKTLEGSCKVLFLSLSVVPGCEQTLSRVLVSFIDITARKLADESLRQSEEKYRKDFILLNSILESPQNIIIFSLDLEYCYSAFTLHHKETMKKIWGADICIGMNMLDIISAQEDRKKAKINFDRALNGEDFSLEEEYGDKKLYRTYYENRYSPIKDSDGNIIGISVFVTDITTRKRAEEDLRVKDRAIESAINAIAISDLDGNLNYINPSFLKMWGYSSKEEVLGRSAIEFWQTDEKAQEIIDALHNTEGWIGELIAKNKDGNLFNVQISGSRVNDNNGQLQNMLASFVNISEKRQTEMKLLESEAKLRAVFECSRDAIGVSKKGVHIFANPAYLALFGYKTDGTIVGTSILDNISPGHHQQIIEKIKQRAGGEQLESFYETRGRKTDGSEFDMEVNVSTYEMDGEIYTIANIRDITGRKQSEAALRESEEKYRTLIEQTTDGVMITDSKGNYVDANSGICQMLGYSRNELLSMNMRHLASEQDIPKQSDTITRMLNGENVITERRLICKNGTLLPAELNAKMLPDGRFCAFVRDLSERKRAEVALRDSEEKYRRLIDLSPDGIFIHINGKFVFSNYAGARILGGKSPEDIIGKIVLDFVHPDYKEIVKSRITKISSESKEVPLMEEKLVRLDGMVIDAEVAGIPFQIEGNPAVQLMIRDISARKKAESEHLRLQNLESLGILAGGIAHDFNNILAVILGRASIALLHASEDRIKNDLQLIEKASKRAAGLTQQLLTFAKGGTPEKCIIDIKRIIQDTARFSLSGSNVTSEFCFSDSLNLDADPGQISQVIQNLVINAKQAMSNGGVINISTQNYIDDNRKHFVKITVKDTGSGIPKENLNKIFDPYFSTKETGTGLGLSVCYSIIKRHEGNLSVESDPGVGSTFTILLPATEKENRSNEKADKFINSKLNILIMDDEDTIRDLLSTLLIESGHQVSVSKEGEEAVRLYKQAKTEGKPYNIVFLDLTIKGGMGGNETVKIIREYDQEAKVVVSSGYANTSVATYLEDGFDGMLKKPYTIEELNEVIFEVMKK